MPEPVYMPLYSAAQVRELDRMAIEEEGISGYQLMCRAGKALAHSVGQAWPEAKRVCILCGSGNNGGDGYVLARLLGEAGCEVLVLYLATPGSLKGDAARAARDYLAGGGEAQAFAGRLPDRMDLLVDALLGTGLDRPPQGPYAQAIEALNAHSAAVLSVDIASGLQADNGSCPGVAVQAQRTLTFIGRKRGQYTGAGVHCSGHIEFDDLSVPADLYPRQRPDVQLVKKPDLGPLARPRHRDAHKGDFGHVLVVGGSAGTAGAARLAAEAALRCGAGLVSVATRPELAGVLNAGCPELMVRGVERAAELSPLLARASVVVAGPGLGQSQWAQGLLSKLLESPLPLLLDADALNLLARDPRRRNNWVLTPHPAEAGRLLDCSASDVQQDRFMAVRRLVENYGGVAVLKGGGSLIAAESEPVRLCPYGNPGMASAGMGDVLSGVVGALLAQGLDRFQAATTGAVLHAQAADIAVADTGERGLLASDLFPFLRDLINGRRG